MVTVACLSLTTTALGSLTVLAGATQIIGAAGKATTVEVGGNIVSGTWTLGNANDVIVASGASIAGVNAGLATTTENLTLTGGITMTQAQSVGLTNISATGGADFITITTGGTVTARAGVETYTVSGGASNNVFVLASTNVNGAAGNATTVNVGGNTVTGNYQLSHGTDVLSATNGANIAGATLATVELLELSGTITLQANQYIQFTGGITATGNNDRIIFTTGLTGGQTLNAAVESFTLADANYSVALGAVQSIDAQALAVGKSLALVGGFAASVALTNGNLSVTSGGNITVTGAGGANTIELDSGNDTVNAGAGADVITGGGGADTLNGDAGNDSFLYAAMADFLTGNAVVDRIDGGADTDAVVISGAIVLTSTSDLARMTTVERLAAQSQSTIQNLHSITISSDAFLGGLTTIDLSGDTKNTSTGAFDLRGITGNLTLKGVGLGTNSFYGGSGADTIVGGGGNDSFFIDNVAHAANDSLTGGGGSDSVVFLSTAGATLVVNDNFNGISSFWTSTTSVVGTSTGTTSENLNASTRTLGGVALHGNAGDNQLTGTSSADTLAGNGGADVLRGGGGNDTINTFAGGVSTYVFEATGSANGSDTLNGVRSGGAFDFRAFLGTAGSMSGSVVDSTSNAAGLDLSAANNIGVRYGSSSLSSTNILLATDVNVAGEVAVANNGKVVVFSFSSASTANSANGSIYYVEDTDPGAGQSWSVTLVGTMSGSFATIAQIVSSGVFL